MEKSLAESIRVIMGNVYLSLGFVYLADGINSLCNPIGNDIMHLLRTFLFDKPNRYPVMTNRTPIDLNGTDAPHRSRIRS